MKRLAPIRLGAALFLGAFVPAVLGQTSDLPRLAEPAPPFLAEEPVVESDDALDCRGLERRINEVRDQPQRRYWLEQRYDADCRRGPVSRSPASPGGPP